MSQGASAHGRKAMEGLRHVHTCHCHDVTRGASASVYTLGDNAHGSGDMSDGYLLGGFLDLDLLVADELAGLHLHDQHALGLILFAAARGALHLGRELLSVDNLIDLEAAHIACVDCDLNTRLDIAATGDYTLNVD